MLETAHTVISVKGVRHTKRVSGKEHFTYVIRDYVRDTNNVHGIYLTLLYT